MNFFNGNVKDIVGRSTKAICGLTEREISVAEKNVQRTINKLRNAGYYIIGTSLPGRSRRTIWFSRAGFL